MLPLLNISCTPIRRTLSPVSAALGIAAVFAVALGARSASAALVNIAYAPADQTVFVGDTVEVVLVVSSQGPGDQPFAAIDAIIGNDASLLELVEASQDDTTAPFFVTGFLPDPDGINLDTSDGVALFTALAPPGSPIPAPAVPAQLIVTTLRFTALAPTDGTQVVLIPNVGLFGHTRVLLGAANITGDISSVANITILPVTGACCVECDCRTLSEEDCILDSGTWQGLGTDCSDVSGVRGLADACESCIGDVDLNLTVDIDDLFFVIGSWGPSPPGDCRADIDLNGVIDIDDLFFVIGAWGPCD